MDYNWFMNTTKEPKELKRVMTIRLTPSGKELLEKLARKWGITQANAIEMTVRRVAEQEGIH
jgi:DNA-binding PadR family transcriptional regulator